jgi:hypothetical protein
VFILRGLSTRFIGDLTIAISHFLTTNTFALPDGPTFLDWSSQQKAQGSKAVALRYRLRDSFEFGDRGGWT